MRLEQFRMVDRVVAFAPEAGRLVAECDVPEQSPVFEGHFPGYPLLPGVLMIEAMAQTGGWLILARNRFARMPLLAQVKAAKLRAFVGPGRRLTAEAVLVHDGSGYAVASGRLTADGQAIAETELTYRTVAFPSPGLRAALLEAARALGLPRELLDAA